MNALCTAVFLTAATLTVSVLPSQAFNVADLNEGSSLTTADFGDAWGAVKLSSQTARLDRSAVCAATDAYFDFDALLTLSTLVGAGGVLAAAFAVARKRPDGDEAWRERVIQAVQADLARFMANERQAA